MKVGQSQVVRWVSKLIAKPSVRSPRHASVSSLRELDATQLRQVSGGDGGSTSSPGKTW